MTISEFVLRLSTAVAAGLLIGIERQWHHKSAGLRTNILVTVGAALYVLLSINMTETKGDVTRIIGQVVTGVGFLGAGLIFKEGLSIHGLTTAVTAWCASALGCTAAAGYYTETLIGTFAVISINLLLLPLDKWLSNRKDREQDTNV
ncbi:MAG: MgtC/SapB family protein [Bacteroidia bacterium]|nr:MgtC/SapB family protein [Bacteroidia bacterium]